MTDFLAIAVVGVAAFVGGFALGVLYLKRKIEEKMAGLMDLGGLQGMEELLDE